MDNMSLLLLTVMKDYKIKHLVEGTCWESIWSKYSDIFVLFIKELPSNEKEMRRISSWHTLPRKCCCYGSICLINLNLLPKSRWSQWACWQCSSQLDKYNVQYIRVVAAEYAYYQPLSYQQYSVSYTPPPSPMCDCQNTHLPCVIARTLHLFNIHKCTIVNCCSRTTHHTLCIDNHFWWTWTRN